MKNTTFDRLLIVCAFTGATLLTACQNHPPAQSTCQADADTCEPVLASHIPNWAYLPYAETESSIYYLDYNAIEVEAQHPQWRNITLLEQPASQDSPRIPQANLSFIAHITIDCEMYTYRVNNVQIYDHPFAQGEITANVTGESVFLPSSSGSLGYAELFTTVCQTNLESTLE